jgi:hypothetical protein
MATKLNKTEKIRIYIEKTQEDIKKRLRKNKYERLEEEYNFEEKIKSIIPCTNCFVRPMCTDKFQTDLFTVPINCEILETFNEAIGYVIKRRTTYKQSFDYDNRLFRYVKKKVKEGKINLD